MTLLDALAWALVCVRCLVLPRYLHAYGTGPVGNPIVGLSLASLYTGYLVWHLAYTRLLTDAERLVGGAFARAMALLLLCWVATLCLPIHSRLIVIYGIPILVIRAVCVRLTSRQMAAFYGAALLGYAGAGICGIIPLWTTLSTGPAPLLGGLWALTTNLGFVGLGCAWVALHRIYVGRRVRESLEILDALPVPIDIVTDRYRVLYANQAQLDRYPHAYSGDPCYRVFHGLDEPCSESKCAMRRACGSPGAAGPGPVRERAGQRLYDITPLCLGSLPAADGSPEVVVMEVLSDVTFLKVLPRAVLRIATHHATRSVLTTMESDVANLLGLAWAHLGSAQPDVARVGGRLERSLEVLKQSVAAEVGELSIEACSPWEIMAEAATAFAGRVRVVLPARTRARAWADRFWLREVFCELLRNVEAHNPPVDRTVYLELNRYVAEPAHVVSVTQYGVELSPDERRQMFDPFFSPKAGRLGLGLWATREILQMMGGTIAVDPERTRDLCLDITLPAARWRGVEQDASSPRG